MGSTTNVFDEHYCRVPTRIRTSSTITAKTTTTMTTSRKSGTNLYAMMDRDFETEAVGPLSSSSSSSKRTSTTKKQEGTTTLSKQPKRTESLDMLIKESFWCLRYPNMNNVCIVECKRRDKQPLGYGMTTSGDNDDEDNNDTALRRRSFAFTSKQRSSNPHLVFVREISFGEGKIGGSVWNGSVAVAQYFAMNPSLVRGKNVLELGSGVGVLGLLVAQLPMIEYVTLSEYGLDDNSYNGLDDTTTTDNMKQEEKRLIPRSLLSNLRYNVQLNGFSCEKVSVRHIDWYDYHPYDHRQKQQQSSLHANDKYDVIIGSDLINWEDDVLPLISTLKYFLSFGQTTKAILSMQQDNRKGVPLFLSEIKQPNLFPNHTVTIEEYQLKHYDDINLCMIFITPMIDQE